MYSQVIPETGRMLAGLCDGSGPCFVVAVVALGVLLGLARYYRLVGIVREAVFAGARSAGEEVLHIASATGIAGR